MVTSIWQSNTPYLLDAVIIPTISNGYGYKCTQAGTSDATLATLTLRPNGAGDETNIDSQVPDSGEHWQKVDEVSPDDADCIGNNTYVEELDLYNLPNVTIQEIVTNVKIFVRISCWYAGVSRVALKTHGQVYYSTYLTEPYGVYTNYFEEWLLNPYTGAPWTGAEINDLQVGLGCAPWDYCSQLYVEVTYLAEPTWPTTLGATVTDSSVIWTNIGQLPRVITKIRVSNRNPSIVIPSNRSPYKVILSNR